MLFGEYRDTEQSRKPEFLGNDISIVNVSG